MLEARRQGRAGSVPTSPVQPGSSMPDIQASLETQQQLGQMLHDEGTQRNLERLGLVPQTQSGQPSANVAQGQNQPPDTGQQRTDLLTRLTGQFSEPLANRTMTMDDLNNIANGILGSNTGSNSAGAAGSPDPVVAAQRLANQNNAAHPVLAVLGIPQNATAEQIGELLLRRQQSGQPLSPDRLRALQQYLQDRQAVDPNFSQLGQFDAAAENVRNHALSSMNY